MEKYSGSKAANISFAMAAVKAAAEAAAEGTGVAKIFREILK